MMITCATTSSAWLLVLSVAIPTLQQSLGAMSSLLCEPSLLPCLGRVLPPPLFVQLCLFAGAVAGGDGPRVPVQEIHDGCQGLGADAND